MLHKQAETLPNGWEWTHWEDGSGHLASPEGKHFFSYDRAPYHNAGGIEYKETESARWDVFWGSFPDFQAHAESIISGKTI